MMKSDITGPYLKVNGKIRGYCELCAGKLDWMSRETSAHYVVQSYIMSQKCMTCTNMDRKLMISAKRRTNKWAEKVKLTYMSLEKLRMVGHLRLLRSEMMLF